MIIATICIIAVLLASGLFLRVCRPDLEALMTFFKGLVDAAVQELSFRGGRAAKSNVFLCVLVGVLFAFLEVHGLFKTIREMIGGESEPNGSLSLYDLFLCLLLFFFFSLCFVASNDRYTKRMKK